MAVQSNGNGRSAAVHPLTPLSAAEITTTASVVRQHFGLKDDANGDTTKTLRFVAISLQEPTTKAKDSVAPRMAEVVTLNPQTGIASELTVDLAKQAVVDVQDLPPGTQPMFTPNDCDLAEEIVQTSEKVQQVLKDRYGISDIKTIACDPWSVHLACDEDRKLTQTESGVPARLVQTFLYQRQYGKDMEDNHYAHPVR